jgi:hypothetical protein
MLSECWLLKLVEECIFHDVGVTRHAAFTDEFSQDRQFSHRIFAKRRQDRARTYHTGRGSWGGGRRGRSRQTRSHDRFQSAQSPHTQPLLFNCGFADRQHISKFGAERPSRQCPAFSRRDSTAHMACSRCRGASARKKKQPKAAAHLYVRHHTVAHLRPRGTQLRRIIVRPTTVTPSDIQLETSTASTCYTVGVGDPALSKLATTQSKPVKCTFIARICDEAAILSNAGAIDGLDKPVTR